MSCSGLHCAGCAGGTAVPVVPIAAVLGLAWIAEHLVEVIIVCGTCGALAFLAMVALMRWCDRRDARYRQLWAARAPEPAPAAVTATVIPQVAQGTWPAVENHVHYHVHVGERETAGVRTMLPGWPGASLPKE